MRYKCCLVIHRVILASLYDIKTQGKYKTEQAAEVFKEHGVDQKESR